MHLNQNLPVFLYSKLQKLDIDRKELDSKAKMAKYCILKSQLLSMKTTCQYILSENKEFYLHSS
ncbi:hypothetical protein B7486_34705 [cyanobacterium TDX16]|nr:hypothetical protein B7486_34705 [cyanobacterium TDX16]